MFSLELLAGLAELCRQSGLAKEANALAEVWKEQLAMRSRPHHPYYHIKKIKDEQGQIKSPLPAHKQTLSGAVHWY